ncbi:hypothetical protein FRB99_005895 [Tulasnella sp. 403]|nr:hypothetical protein FRB99_005895 [Tulasnella sp. 403]
MASFAPRPGCPLCSIVSTPYPSSVQSPRSPFFPDGPSRNGNPASAPPPQIVHKDENVTVYLEKNYPVSSKGHLVIVLNYHVPSIYMLSSSDLPLLTHMQRLGETLLNRHVNGTLLPGQSASQTNPTSPDPETPNFSQTVSFADTDPASKFHIGFIVSPFSDPKIPVTDHVHCHAYIGNLDLAGWWRKINYSGMGWWAIEDLIAEIREQTSNNRVKSGYGNRASTLDAVPEAGARIGLPNGVEIPAHSVTATSPTSPTAASPRRIPSLAITADESDPITPRVAAAEEGRKLDDDGSPALQSSGSSQALNRLGSAASGTGKRPMGPRTKDSVGPGNTIQLGQVSSNSPSPSASPEPAAIV